MRSNIENILAVGSAHELRRLVCELSRENDALRELNVRLTQQATNKAMTPTEKKLFDSLQLKADMFDYLCWLEDYCVFRKAALDGKAGDYLVMASDGTTCWGKTYVESVRMAMEHDKQLQDATTGDAIMTAHLRDGGTPCS